MGSIPAFILQGLDIHALRNISKRLKALEIDTSHFNPNIYRRNPSRKGNGNKKSSSEVLVKKTSGNREHSAALRRALIEEDVLQLCIKCNQKPSWNGKPLTLEINHKNGNWRDNRKKNLEFICPNCHSQEPISY